jgi:hypothetical protein
MGTTQPDQAHIEPYQSIDKLFKANKNVHGQTKRSHAQKASEHQATQPVMVHQPTRRLG